MKTPLTESQLTKLITEAHNAYKKSRNSADFEAWQVLVKELKKIRKEAGKAAQSSLL